MRATLANDGESGGRRIVGGRACALAALAALIGLVVALLAAAPAQAWAPLDQQVREALALRAGAGQALAEKQRARYLHRGIGRHRAVGHKPWLRGRTRHIGQPQPAAPAATAPADPGPVTAPGEPLPAISASTPAPAAAADERPGPQGDAALPPVGQGVGPGPEPASPPAGEPEPPAEEPPVQEPPAEEPPAKEPPAEEPETPPVQEPEPPPSEEPETPPAEEPESPPPAAEEPFFAGRTIRNFSSIQAAPGAVTEVLDPLGSGEKVLRMTVDDGDVAPITPTENPRAQALSPAIIDPGDEFWLKTKFLVPRDFPTVTKWLSLVEIHGPPFRGSSPWQVELIGDHLQWRRPGAYGSDVPWEAPLPKGSWVTLLLHERFATDGFVEMWIDGQQVTFFSGRGSNPGQLPPTTRLEMKTMDASNGGGANAAKIMNYRQAGMFESGTIYFGPLLLGTTRAAVDR